MLAFVCLAAAGSGAAYATPVITETTSFSNSLSAASAGTQLAFYDPTDYQAGLMSGSIGVAGSVSGSHNGDYFAYITFTSLPAGAAFTWLFEPTLITGGRLDGEFEIIGGNAPPAYIGGASPISGSGIVPGNGSITVAVLDENESSQLNFLFTLDTNSMAPAADAPVTGAPEPATFGTFGLALLSIALATVGRRRGRLVQSPPWSTAIVRGIRCRSK